MKNYLIIGAGFSGSVLARQLVDSLDCVVAVWDERPHIAGNCHTERDSETGVMVHQYGPHIFNTDNEKVWNYMNHYGELRPFINRVKAFTSRGIFSLPVNLHTINQFFGKTMSPEEARRFVAGLGDQSITEPRNFEEQALKMLGSELYETFFKGYTVKQWGCDPKELPAAILKRLPVRFNYDDNYYSKRFQGIPAAGYTEIVRRILDHPRINVCLNKKFDMNSKSISVTDESKALESCSTEAANFAHVFYTGPLDAFFNYCEGRLGYRTVTFKRIDTDRSDFQGTAVINYPDLSVPWTRIHEHKHFAPWEQNDRTVAFQEYSKETESTDIPYYPKRLSADKSLLLRYRKLAEEFASRTSISGNQCAKVSFLGRLATYRYMDMETVISEALDFADSFIASIASGNPPQVFPNAENA